MNHIDHILNEQQTNEPFCWQIGNFCWITKWHYRFLRDCHVQKRELVKEKQTLEAHCAALTEELASARNTIAIAEADAALTEQNRQLAEQLDHTPLPVPVKHPRKKV